MAFEVNVLLLYVRAGYMDTFAKIHWAAHT